MSDAQADGGRHRAQTPGTGPHDAPGSGIPGSDTGSGAAQGDAAPAAAPRSLAHLLGSRLGLGTTAAVLLVTFASGILFSLSAAQSRDTTLRGEVDLVTLVREREDSVQELQAQTTQLRAQVDTTVAQLDGRQGQDTVPAPDLALSDVTGPGLTVTLTDAPPQTLPGVNPDDLVIHQQDVEAVMNALWAGGAEAMTVQGARITTRTVIRCIGNVILVDGRSYSPPYVVSAIGDPGLMQAALDSDAQIAIYKQYVSAYQLGWKVEEQREIQMPAASQQTPLSAAKVSTDNE